MGINPIKIVIIITDLSTGGAQMMLLKILQHLGSRFSPHVISLSDQGEIGSRIQELGVSAESLGMRPGVPSLRAFFRLVRRLKELKPDVVHTWLYHADLLGGLAARFSRVGAIGWCIRHSNLDRDKNKFTTRVVVAACARISPWVPDRILCCSEVARQIHVEAGYAAEKMEVIPNGFDITKFQPDPLARTAVRSELVVTADTPLVGVIGRYSPQKNHVGFLRAAGQLHRRFPDVRFLLAGKGINEANSELSRDIDDAGIRSVTHLLGLRSDVSRLMAALDILVSSSTGEAFSNVLGEAMACGVPCVVTDVGDSAYIVGDTGKVVPVNDMAGLAAAMESLLLLPAKQRQTLGERARARIAENFEIGQVAKRYEYFYEELAALGRVKRFGS